MQMNTGVDLQDDFTDGIDAEPGPGDANEAAELRQVAERSEFSHDPNDDDDDFDDVDIDDVETDEASDSETNAAESGEQDGDTSGQDNSESGEAHDDFDADLLALAESRGFTAEEARAFRNPDHLARALVALDRKAALKPEGESAAKPEGEGQQTHAEGKETADAGEPDPFTFEKLKLEFDPDEWDEDTARILNGINDHYHGFVEKMVSKIKEQEQTLKGLNAAYEHERKTKFDSDMDNFFVNLGDEYADVFGKGTLSEVGADSPAGKARFDLVNEMQTIANIDAQLGRPPVSLEKLRQRALGSLHADKIEKKAGDKLAKKVNERRGQSIAKPTGRSTTTKLSPEQRAVARVEQAFRERGLNTDDDEIDDEI